MPRDERTFITVHDGMPEHPKIEGLSDKAFRLLVETWCWCSRNRTDGKVRAASWTKRGTPKSREELVDAGLAKPTDDGVQIHDYLEHQRSAAEIDELSRRRSEAGKKGGLATATAKASAVANAQASAAANGQQNGSKVQAESETDTEELLRSSQRARPITTNTPRFVEFWESYPRRVGKPEALKAFAKALTRADADRIVKGAQRHRDDPNREDAFTAHPATWLNRDGWDDEPIPARGNRAREDDPMGWAR